MCSELWVALGLEFGISDRDVCVCVHARVRVRVRVRVCVCVCVCVCVLGTEFCRIMDVG